MSFSQNHHQCYHHHHPGTWLFPKIVVPQNGWFIIENPIKIHDLGGFPPMFGNTHIPFSAYPPPRAIVHVLRSQWTRYSGPPSRCCAPRIHPAKLPQNQRSGWCIAKTFADTFMLSANKGGGNIYIYIYIYNIYIYICVCVNILNMYMYIHSYLSIYIIWRIPCKNQRFYGYFQ